MESIQQPLEEQKSSETLQNKMSRADLRRSTRSVRNSNESDITKKSANTPRDVVRSNRPSFESTTGKTANTTSRDILRSARSSLEMDASRRSANTPRDVVRSNRPSLESNVGKSVNTPREGLRSTRSSFESDARRSLKTSDTHNSGNSIYSNDELHHREYVDAVVNGDLEHVQRGIEVHKIDPNYCSTDGFNALFAARYESFSFIYIFVYHPLILFLHSFHPAIHQLGRTFACSQLFIEQGFQCECGRSLHKVLSYTCSSHGWLRGGVESLVRCRSDTPIIDVCINTYL